MKKKTKPNAELKAMNENKVKKYVAELEFCPECGMKWTYKVEGKTYWKLIGLEDPNLYDGVSWWVCPGCEAKWDRWTGELVSEGKKKGKKMAKQLDKIVVVDVETTCWDGDPPKGETNEIIEIGVCLLDIKSLERERKTSILVCPTRSKVSPFCTKLTTLTQQDVDSGTSFAEACARLAREFDTPNRTWASYGDYDRGAFERQCRDMGIRYPFGKTHINVKNLFAIKNQLPREVGMDEALKILDISLEGTHHRGGDDAWNIASILKRVLERDEDVNAAFICVQKEADPLGSKAITYISYWHGTPKMSHLESVQRDLYGEEPSGESGFKIQKVKSALAESVGIEAWYLGQVWWRKGKRPRGGNREGRQERPRRRRKEARRHEGHDRRIRRREA